MGDRQQYGVLCRRAGYKVAATELSHYKEMTMTDEQIEKAAQRHADELRVRSSIPGALVPMLHDIAKSSYACGAQDALRNQWVSVKERLPEDGRLVVVRLSLSFGCDGYDIARYDEYWRCQLLSRCGEGAIVTHWCALPQLDPEKGER